MSSHVMLARQVRFEQMAFWRNRAAMVGTFLFPIMFLAIFGSIFKGETIESRGELSYLTFFVPGILAFGVITSTYMQLATGLAVQRDQGILKRIKGTPLPKWIFLSGRIGSVILTTAVLAAITILVGVVVYDVSFQTGTVPGLIVALVMGTFCFAALGFATTILIPNAEAAPVVVNLLLFPILFVSGVFFPLDDAPGWLDSLAGVFPIKHFASALQFVFDPTTTGAGLAGTDLVPMGIWGLGGALVALRFFRWDPQKS